MPKPKIIIIGPYPARFSPGPFILRCLAGRYPDRQDMTHAKTERVKMAP